MGARVLAGWLLAGLASWLLLPWYLGEDGSGWPGPAALWGDAQRASGLAQALAHGRPWLLAGLAGLALAALGAWPAGRRTQGRWLVAGGVLGVVGLLAGGLAIGAHGWSWPALQAVFGALPAGQPGLGAGGGAALVTLAALGALGLARLGGFGGDRFVAIAVVLCAGALALWVGYPVLRALAAAVLDAQGMLSAAALADRIAGERVWGLGCVTGGGRCGVAWNTLVLAGATATATTVLGTAIALLAERGPRQVRRPLNGLALLPIITPPFVMGLGLILLFGRAGLVNRALELAFDLPPTRWFYGLFGTWLAQTFAFTPIAFMIMRGMVQGVSPSLEEAAQTMRADRATVFRTVTLPLLAPGLANAFLVGFIESMADFGNPIVVGGSYAVLSTEIFFAIVGAQYDAGRAAALAALLSIFALAAFALQRRLLAHRRFTTVSGKGDAGVPMALPTGVARIVKGLAYPWLGFTAVVYLFAFSGGFVRLWGRDYTPTLAHFASAFGVRTGPGGALEWVGAAWSSFFTTMTLAAIAAPLCAALGLLIAWLLARTRFRGRDAFEFGALVAFAIPGTVLGVSYVMAFNVPPFELTGTALIIVLCFVFRNLPVGVRAGAAAFEQIDASLDEASTMLGAPTAVTLRRVVLPLLRPALAAALVYAFVRSVTTVSAVIFLVTAEHELATTFIIGRVGNGDYGVALAYCTVLIVAMSVAVGAIHLLVGERRLARREPHARPIPA